jgi:regulator of sigma E protease
LDNVNQSGAGNTRAGADGAESARSPWGLSQAIMVALLAIMVIALFRHFGVEGMISIALVAVGLGFVVFIHELGHFAVAKWCDVHVETFSIGFGPAIPGCSFRRGETLYKIAWFPLGGYVKMVGEGTESEEDDNDPRSFKNKSVWQRMAIISAGVIMNVILGFVCFIFVYRTHGAEQPVGEIGLVDIGSRAWIKGAQTGAVIDQIGDIQQPSFEDLRYVVMLSAQGEQLPFTFHQPGQPPRSVEVEPRRDKDDLHPVIGLQAPSRLQLLPKERPPFYSPVLHDSAAARATPAFRFNDTIVAMTDPADPTRVTPMAPDPRHPSGKQLDYFEFRQRLKLLEGKPITVRVRRHGTDPHETPEEVDIRVPPAFHYTLGLRMRIGQVTAVRENSPAADPENGVQALGQVKGVDGDILKEVEVTGPDGKRIRFVTTRSKMVPAGVTEVDLDPIRLPDELEAWAASIPDPARRVVSLRVLRKVGHEGRKTFPAEDKPPLRLKWDDSWSINREVPFSPRSPLSLPGLGLAYQVEAVVEGVEENSPAFEAGLKRDDVIKAIRFQEPSKTPGESVSGKWIELESSDQWAHYFWMLQELDFKEVTLRVERGNQKPGQEVHLFAREDPAWPAVDRGLLFRPDTRLLKANSLGEAVAMGLKSTRRSIVMICLNLKAILTNRISYKTVGGPIMIATVAYDIASENLYRFILFLGMISINLAVINFLPIPILDGGHMVFLIYEKIRGIPASEAVRTYAGIVGLVLILGLMVFVFWQDIMRLF